MRRVGLIFHGIGAPRRHLEQGEAPFWISVASFERVLDRIAALPDPGGVRITFDDGNLSDFDVALPRLLARGLHARVFVLADRLDKPGSLSTGDLRALRASGMDVGSHGCGHRDLRRLDAAALAEELARSKVVLQQAVGEEISEFAIPFGAYSGTVLRAIRDAGYRAAWTSDRGTMSDTAFLRPRTSIRGDTDDAEVGRILAGRLAPVEAVRRRLGMIRRRLSRS